MNFLTPGMQYMLLGTFLFSIGSLCVKLSGLHVPTTEILFVRGVVGVLLCWYILRRAGVGVFGKRKLALFLRGLLGFTSMLAEFYTIVHLPLADALVLLFSHPIVVALLGWFILRERLSKGSLVAVLISLVGVTVVCRPGILFGAKEAMDPFLLGVALLAVLLTSFAILTVRSLAKTEHPAVVMFYPPLFIALLAPLFAGEWVVPTVGEWCTMLGVAVFMNMGQYYMTRGYAIESAARISGVSSLEIVFAGMWGVMFLNEIPDVWTVLGGVLIVLGTVVLGRSARTEMVISPKFPLS
ncbi:DMT family transporter [uncultured Pseudodesulfovibrio sp.]|uniref:DMT family transporter n=1 Tax=uncultured Pseudodesulfovibrio sp. TaxID=2035858 RepID=UPI0029C75BD1|nr:DMT family transporter [uncultured Pseudodesulfovibrio sp.]